MQRKILVGIILVFSLSSATTLAQNSNTSPSVRPRKTATTITPSTNFQKKTDEQEPATTQPKARSTPAKPKVVGTQPSSSQSVTEAFNVLLKGIRDADVKAVSSVYWNSPRLILFNNNGSVTKGWEQMRKNRESSYQDMKDTKLEVRDISISMLGTTGAVVSCLWKQSQTYKGTPETATGRMTLVFKRVGNEWKAIHLHTSPDRPDQNRVLPSEQASPAASSSPN